MDMAMKIRIALLKRNMSITELAEKLGTSRSNLSGKLSRNNFSTQDLVDIAAALDCDLEMNFIMKDTSEKIQYRFQIV